MESSDLRMLALLHTGSHCQWDFANTERRESLRGNAHDGKLSPYRSTSEAKGSSQTLKYELSLWA